jgi:hypothetical protein
LLDDAARCRSCAVLGRAWYDQTGSQCHSSHKFESFNLNPVKKWKTTVTRIGIFTFFVQQSMQGAWLLSNTSLSALNISRTIYLTPN